MEKNAFLIFLALFCIGALYLGQGISGYSVTYLNPGDGSATFYVVYILIGIVLVLMAVVYRKMINTVKKVF
jgi:uncharacterized membrane protein YuzA (DUF378 family)